MRAFHRSERGQTLTIVEGRGTSRDQGEAEVELAFRMGIRETETPAPSIVRW